MEGFVYLFVYLCITSTHYGAKLSFTERHIICVLAVISSATEIKALI